MLVLPAKLTHDDAAACVRMLVEAMKREPSTAIVADASPLSAFDSSALAALLQCRREALALGKSFSLAHMHPRLRDLASLYGVGELLPASA